MEISDMTWGLIIGVTGSLMATAISYKYLDRRQKNIKRKLEELDYEEKHLEKINKGNVALLRSCFKTIFLCLGIFGSAGGIIAFSLAMKLPQFVIYNVMMLSSAALLAGGLGAFVQFKTLMKLNDLPKAKSQINQQRAKLNQKLK